MTPERLEECEGGSDTLRGQRVPGLCLFAFICPYRVEKKRKRKLIAQLCLTFCDPMDCSQPGSSVHGILRARILGDDTLRTQSPALVLSLSFPTKKWGNETVSASQKLLLGRLKRLLGEAA